MLAGMDEEWRPVVGLEKFFEVSDRGRIRWRSSKDELASHKGTIYGHRRVYFGFGSPKQQYVHRVVLEAFVGPCPDGLQGCHNDGDPTNNRLENLRWDTPSSNQYDRVSHGKHHHANRIRCPHGHLLDAVKNHGDGEFWQRRCGTCTREANREREAAKWAKVDTCKKGHPLDGVSTWADGSERGRFCKTCRSENVSRQMTERHAKNRAEKTHCKYGHPMDGLRKRPGGLMVPYCKTCLRESSRRNHAKKAQR